MCQHAKTDKTRGARDLSNQLVRVLQNSNQVAEYTYNGAGQRIKKLTQTETKIFHYDLLGHLIGETDQYGQTIAEYVYLGDQLLAMIKPGESVYYFHNDHLGTPQVLTDDAQAIAWKAAYTPFGEAVASIENVENPFRFPGQYYDAETGLHYNYFRYCNPQTGRYITPNPIGLEGGINLFSYVGGNPVNYTDPEGLFWPIDCVRCFYYMARCAKEGLNCKENKCKENEDVTSSEVFNECYKGIPACQKQLKYCGKCALAPKGIPSPPSSTIPPITPPSPSVGEP
ncbi:MAG: RHS domain-containing protein [Syntrophaceae bacterium]|nr:RHS domain-containing protein [Syntrophaceae bacterium]